MGKAVLITGCDTGLGHHLALRLNERGFRVYATVVSESSAGAQQLTSKARFAHKMHVIGMDVTKHDQVQKAYDYVTLHLNENGHGDCLWALVNNSAIVDDSLVEWGLPEIYEHVFAVNMFGVIRVTRTFLPLIRKLKGRIVNVASVAGHISPPLCVWYSMSKHAVIAFSDTLRREMRSFGVRVAIIEPGGFSTQVTNETLRHDKLCRTWQHTSDQVKQAYGPINEHDIKAMIRASIGLFQLSTNLDIATNDMIDAIQSAEPGLMYTPTESLMVKIMAAIMVWMPSAWLDQILGLTNPVKYSLCMASIISLVAISRFVLSWNKPMLALIIAKF
ncbi:unnamed protein product [Medioppia subpectinata]|uniref:Uncharacterized protein n=1 Tax=Medioppia subpectinata TaxID=1979941 RepID=A0A7R9Q9R2_9ACAR|nr:unnamed protein product [Medioppia subpectinata]CAG2116774.1 unnamed protein product [Medioppia subpectinata]